MIRIALDGADGFTIDGASYKKGTVTVIIQPDGYRVTFIHNDEPLYEAIPYYEIEDGDNGNAVFASIVQFKIYTELYINLLASDYIPFRHVAEGDDNATLIKKGQTVLSQLLAVNTSETATQYVKLYDTDTVPTSGDTPVMTIPLPKTAEDKTYDIIKLPVQFFYGFGFRITGALDDGDDTAAEANAVILNLAIR